MVIRITSKRLTHSELKCHPEDQIWSSFNWFGLEVGAMRTINNSLERPSPSERRVLLLENTTQFLYACESMKACANTK